MDLFALIAGHIPWCDYDPCFRRQGGICLYKNGGKDYICMCEVGYTQINDGQFIRCQGESDPPSILL